MFGIREERDRIDWSWRSVDSAMMENKDKKLVYKLGTRLNTVVGRVRSKESVNW